MTGRSAALQGGLAALGLVAAHLTWQREPERAPGEIAVIDASKADVGRVRWEDDDNVITFERRTEGGEPAVWLHVEVKPRAPAAKPNEPTPPATPSATPPRDVRGSIDALRLVDRFAPLLSPRAFGVLEDAKLKELGLEAPKRHLEVVVRGDTRKYDVGVAANAQNGESFLRDVRDKRVYLMPRGVLAEFGNTKRLIDSRLHAFETKDFDRMTVAVGDKRKELVHLNRENFAAETFAPAKAPDKHDQMAKNWHDSLWRSFPMEVLGKDEVPKPGALKVAVRVDYLEKNKPVGWVEVARLEGGSGGKSADVSDGLYARSEHTVGWTRLHATEQLLTDAEHVATSP